ncbi:MAG: hypothetical protein HFI19_08955 [Lachnospiraceae bacterium]|nr:hypothetical protein [Lachnospiraceae bacterium]
MTKRQFKENLLRGRGCCMQALQEDRENYREVILWACSHSLAFDPQCEGSRAWYLYQFICCFPDKETFLTAAIDSFRHTRSNGNWKFLYLAELLNQFSLDGFSAAQQALWHKYEMLYAQLMKKKLSPGQHFPQRDDFEMLCIILAENKTAFIKIAEDIGRLYEKKSLYHAYDFLWLYDSRGRYYLTALVREAMKSRYLEKYLIISQEYEKVTENRKECRPQALPLTGVRLSLRLQRINDPEALLPYAEAYLGQSEPKARAEALTAFCRCPYPKDPLPIIKDAKSQYKSLNDAAWEALSNIRHPLVRKFALEELKGNPNAALPVLIKNYQEQDARLLEGHIQAIPVNFRDTTGWHGIHLYILSMKDDRQKAPASLLSHIYETTYCSCCREYTLYQMGKRRLLTNKLLQECLFDSNEEIRKYAKRILKRREKSTACNK